MPITEETLDRIISASERRKFVPFSDMHIWRLEQQDKFPKRVHLGPRRVGWSLNEIMEWINFRKSER